MFFYLPAHDDGATLTEVAGYARSHTDRLVTVRCFSRGAELPHNMQLVDHVSTACDVDLVASSTMAIVDEYRRRNIFSVLLGTGSEAVTMDDLIDDILPLACQPDEATRSSSDTNTLPSRLQSNWDRAAS